MAKEKRLVRYRAAIGLATALSLGATSARADDDPFYSDDKALHFAVSFGVASVSYAALVPLTETRAPRLLIAGTTGLAVGAAKELADLAGSGDPSWKDFAWDAMGVTAGTLFAWGLDLALEGSHPKREQMRFVPTKRTPLALRFDF